MDYLGVKRQKGGGGGIVEIPDPLPVKTLTITGMPPQAAQLLDDEWDMSPGIWDIMLPSPNYLYFTPATGGRAVSRKGYFVPADL
jgi:hypothetical protein